MGKAEKKYCINYTIHSEEELHKALDWTDLKKTFNPFEAYLTL